MTTNFFSPLLLLFLDPGSEIRDPPDPQQWFFGHLHLWYFVIVYVYFVLDCIKVYYQDNYTSINFRILSPVPVSTRVGKKISFLILMLCSLPYHIIVELGIRYPGSRPFLTPGSGMEENLDPVSHSRDPGFIIPDHISESLVTIFGLKFFVNSRIFDLNLPNARCSGSRIRDLKIRIRDQRSGINIPYPQHRIFDSEKHLIALFSGKTKARDWRWYAYSWYALRSPPHPGSLAGD